MSDFGFWFAFTLLIIIFTPPSCKVGDPSIASSIVAYLNAKAKP